MAYHRLVASRANLLSDKKVIALYRQIRAPSPNISTCGAVGQRCSAFLAAYRDVCTIGREEEDCGDRHGALSCLGSNLVSKDDSPVAEEVAAELLAKAVQGNFAGLDDAVENVTVVILDELLGGVAEKVLSQVTTLTQSLSCSSLREALADAVDSSCFKLVVGLLGVRDALFGLGVCSLVTALMMYLLWLRTVQYGMLLHERDAGVHAAASGGSHFNSSTLSKKLALGLDAAIQRSPALRLMEPVLSWPDRSAMSADQEQSQSSSSGPARAAAGAKEKLVLPIPARELPPSPTGSGAGGGSTRAGGGSTKGSKSSQGGLSGRNTTAPSIWELFPSITTAPSMSPRCIGKPEEMVGLVPEDAAHEEKQEDDGENIAEGDYFVDKFVPSEGHDKRPGGVSIAL
eukprot:gnl/TRDRNA2_/TRDRNA2_144935_c1_seq1.p1 gnl/TRDRNA2_/TRDRNA2_144935_c1~~gnl/TRDRNA2_/TRDRNA2_144935_c1_seq1.p1  ORF type:complete len:401 (-),score=68.77 gnl/TRDRNA2_/TRDRNA2_144935_c1_seq1:123-1325(-)